MFKTGLESIDLTYRDFDGVVHSYYSLINKLGHMLGVNREDVYY